MQNIEIERVTLIRVLNDYIKAMKADDYKYYLEKNMFMGNCKALLETLNSGTKSLTLQTGMSSIALQNTLEFGITTQDKDTAYKCLSAMKQVSAECKAGKMYRITFLN